MDDNLYALFRSRFPADPAAPCIETPDGAVISYAEVERETARIARLLRSLGITAGERVLAQLDKSPRALLLYLACLRTGAAYIPLNTAYTLAELEYFVSDAEPRVVVCRPQTAADLDALCRRLGIPHLLTLDAGGEGTLADRAAAVDPDPEIATTEADDVAAICYTSGTTGRSKGAMLTHRNLASNALTLHWIWGWVPGDVLLHCLPIFHVHGLFVATHCALLNGSPMLFLRAFEVDGVLKALARATVMMGVPTYYTRLLASEELTAERCRAMRLFISGSAPLREDTFRAFEARTGHRILERYGMTEALMIASNPLDGERLPGTVGYPLPGVEARIANDAGRILSPGEVGTLEIRGPNVFKGYWRMPDKTAETFRADGFFITGDVVTVAEDGRISIVGRAKDLIISGGYNVYPKEIEQAIDAIPGVAESAVFGVYHPDFGEAVMAAVVREPGADALGEDEIMRTLAGRLARFKQPKRIVFLAALPRNAMGKVQKNELRQTYDDTFRR